MKKISQGQLKPLDTHAQTQENKPTHWASLPCPFDKHFCTTKKPAREKSKWGAGIEHQNYFFILSKILFVSEKECWAEFTWIACEKVQLSWWILGSWNRVIESHGGVDWLWCLSRLFEKVWRLILCSYLVSWGCGETVSKNQEER